MNNTQIEVTANFAASQSTLTELLMEHDAPQVVTDATEDLINNLIHNSAVTSHRVVTALQLLEQERRDWETTELAASHSRLYSILTKCYEFYMTMKSASTDQNVRLQMTKGLEAFINLNGFKTLAKTHDMNRVVKAVFGEDRRRVSAYASALRIALTSGGTSATGFTLSVPVSDLANWITEKGGIEEIRKTSAKQGPTAKQRVETARAALQKKPLMTFKPNTKSLQFDTNDSDKVMVLIAIYRPTGEVEISGVIKSEAVVNLALAAHYEANKDEMANVELAAQTKAQSAVSIALNNGV